MDNGTSRRDFLKSSAALAAGLAAMQMSGGVHAAGSDTLKVGLIGCGQRGSGAATQALNADKNVQLVAMADAFADRIEESLQSIRKDKVAAEKIDVPPERRFVGFDAYKQLLASGVDVVLLATPPGFRPLHIKAAVDAGKHIFAEKPCAVDAPGVRSVLAACEEAKKKNLSVVSGLCLRYSRGFNEAIKRIHDGQLGDVVALQANDYRGPLKPKVREKGWSEMTWQMRNWYHYTWLSGDFNVEQHVHFLDVCAWAMKNEYPVRAVGMGGRQTRTDENSGHIYDHFAVVYEYANGVRLFSNCRQQNNCAKDMCAYVMGSKGRAEISDSGHQIGISGASPWKFQGPDNDFYQTEHDELFASIRDGKPINNGEYMAKSTLLAIMGRMAAYTGQMITWEKAMASVEDLTPPKYDWDAPMTTPPVAMPGQTKFR